MWDDLCARPRLLVFAGKQSESSAPYGRQHNRGEFMFIHFAVPAFTTRRLLQRECPICRHVQIVAPSKMRETVTCERCDYLIPSRRKQAV
jgi:hypothetical protein